uniref:tumor necrosis factor receptor superfamily member 1B-like n=1 Tax=Pristiophorus japonicus TaxID=55135 RepID=UPI00398E90B9
MISQPFLCLLLSLSSAALSDIAIRKDYPPYKKTLLNCLNTTTEYFDSKIQMCCSKCPPGWRKSQQCSATTDTECARCGEHQFTGFWNTLKKCRACEATCSTDQEMVQDCTRTTMRICHCREGLHCIDSTTTTCNHCQKHTACQEGHGVNVQGTKDTNVECAPCDSGTFSNNVSATERCTPHTDCAMQGRKTLHNGSSITDAVCSNELLPRRGTTQKSGLSLPALIQVTHPTEVEAETVSSSDITPSIGSMLVEPSMNSSPAPSLSLNLVVAISCGTIIMIGVAIVIMFCLLRKRAVRKPDLWDPSPNVPSAKANPVETVCLIGVNESELEVVSPGNGMCEQNSNGTGSVSGADQLGSLSRSSSSGSRGVRRKPDTGYSLKEEDRTQTHLALAHFNNYSRIDSQEDQGYISRESRPSSGTPSPVIECGGNPTVSVTINTGKCYVNFCHRRGDVDSGPGPAEEDFPAPVEEGTEVDEGYPIQEEQKGLESDKWKEAGVLVGAESEGHWRQYNSTPHQEDRKELQLSVQDTSGNVY